MVGQRDDKNCRFGCWSTSSRKKYLTADANKFLSSARLLEHNALSTVKRKKVSGERCEILAVTDNTVTRFRCSEKVIQTVDFKFASVPACSCHNQAQIDNKDSLMWRSFTSSAGDISCIELELSWPKKAVVPEKVVALVPQSRGPTAHCLGAADDIFADPVEPPLMVKNVRTLRR